jgi:hypothetical protein
MLGCKHRLSSCLVGSCLARALHVDGSYRTQQDRRRSAKSLACGAAADVGGNDVPGQLLTFVTFGWRGGVGGAQLAGLT